MKTSDFNYHLPDELIANYPLKKRSLSRLLVFKNDIEHIFLRTLLNIFKKVIYWL